MIRAIGKKLMLTNFEWRTLDSISMAASVKLSDVLADTRGPADVARTRESFRQFLRELDDPPNGQTIGREQRFLEFVLELPAALESQESLLKFGEKYFLCESRMKVSLPNFAKRDELEAQFKELKEKGIMKDKLKEELINAKSDVTECFLKPNFEEFLNESC